MSDSESHDREASTAVGRQSTDDNPAAAAHLGDGHGRKIRMAAVQNDNPAPRDGDDSIDRRGQGDSQLSQRRAADIDAGAPTAEAGAIKNQQRGAPLPASQPPT